MRLDIILIAMVTTCGTSPKTQLNTAVINVVQNGKAITEM